MIISYSMNHQWFGYHLLFLTLHTFDISSKSLQWFVVYATNNLSGNTCGWNSRLTPSLLVLVVAAAAAEVVVLLLTPSSDDVGNETGGVIPELLNIAGYKHETGWNPMRRARMQMEDWRSNEESTLKLMVDGWWLMMPSFLFLLIIYWAVHLLLVIISWPDTYDGIHNTRSTSTVHLSFALRSLCFNISKLHKYNITARKKEKTFTHHGSVFISHRLEAETNNNTPNNL